MDGIHDLGGREGFGAIERESEHETESDEPAFHARWEAAVFAMLFAAGRVGATGNADRFRHAIERIDPVAYLSHGYYGRWLGGLETLLVEAGVIDRDTLTARAAALAAAAGDPAPRGRIASRPQQPPDRVAPPDDPSSRRSLAERPRFEVGDDVLTCSHGVRGHTRLPAYARGRRGTISAWHDGWVLPDTNAHGAGEQPAHLYTVAFSARELWGERADRKATIRLDLFEPYLLPAADQERRS